jgi:ABC-type transporter Mla subunit MlaD
VEVAGEVDGQLKEIVGYTKKVTELIANVSAASEEQAKGTEQVNIALSQLSDVTQANAATSEESSAASQTLESQAAELHALVKGLLTVVHGSGGGETNEPAKVSESAQRHAPSISSAIPAVKEALRDHPKHPEKSVH